MADNDVVYPVNDIEEAIEISSALEALTFHFDALEKEVDALHEKLSKKEGGGEYLRSFIEGVQKRLRCVYFRLEMSQVDLRDGMCDEFHH